MANKYPFGQSIKTQGVFTDPDNDNAHYDPDVVKVTIRDEKANVTTYTFGTGEIIKVSTGIYTYTWTPDNPGDWFYRFHSETAASEGEAADEEKITVLVPQAV